MTKAFLFWLIFVLSVLAYFGLIFGPDTWTWKGNATHVIEFVLIGLLGWETFGPAVK